MSNSVEISFEADPTEDYIFSELETEDHLNMTISGDKNIHEKAEELLSFLKSYFEDLKEELSKCSLYFKYILQVPEILSSCFIMNPCLPREMSGKDVKHKNLKTAEVCLKILLSYLECPQTVDATKEIIQIAIPVIYQAYSHCKDSENFYGELFDEFTNELGSFYKHIQDVQKITLKRIEVLLNADSYNINNERTEIILISRGVGRLCELVATLDQNVAIIFWKIFSKLILKYKDALLENLEIDAFLLPLILNIEEIVSQCIYNIESNEQVVEAEIKLCIIELSLLKKIVQTFSGYFIDTVIVQLRNLCLKLFSLLVTSHAQTVADSKDVNVVKILLKTAKHAILPFFSDKMFFNAVFYCQQKDISHGFQLPLLLLKMAAIDCLKCHSGHSQNLQSGEVLVEIFSTLQNCKLEDDLKLVYLKIPISFMKETEKESNGLITLYQHCYMCLVNYFKEFLSCSNISTLLEDKLFSFLTLSSDVVYLLISDVWMFYLRSGSLEGVFKWCCSAAKIVNQDMNPRVNLLFTRILKLLPDHYKVRLFEDNKNLYSLLINNATVPRFGFSQFKNTSLTSSLNDEKINDALRNLEKHPTNDVHELVLKSCSVLDLCILSNDSLSTAELLKFVEFVSIVCKSEIYEIQTGVISFFKVFSGKTLSKSDKTFDTLTSAIAQLLSDLMQSENYVIRLEALNLYFRLAETTPHPEIIRKVAMKCPRLVPSLKSYAEKVPTSGFLKEDVKHSMYEKQLSNYFTNSELAQTYPEKSRLLLSSLLT